MKDPILLKYLRARLDDLEPDTYVFTDDKLYSFIELAYAQETKNAAIITSWAYIYALMSQVPREAGRELKINDNGVIQEPPKLADKLLRLIELELGTRIK